MFADQLALEGLHPSLLRHAALNFSAEDVLTFLGRKLHHCFAGEILNNCKKRWPGARVKHHMKQNWNRAGYSADDKFLTATDHIGVTGGEYDHALLLSLQPLQRSLRPRICRALWPAA